jgi:hypothetical protein
MPGQTKMEKLSTKNATSTKSSPRSCLATLRNPLFYLSQSEKRVGSEETCRLTKTTEGQDSQGRI